MDEEEDEECYQENVRWIENKVQGTREMGCIKKGGGQRKRKMFPGKRCDGQRKRKNGSKEKNCGLKNRRDGLQGTERWIEEEEGWLQRRREEEEW